MKDTVHQQRATEAEVDPLFPQRWSPRSFLSDPVPGHQLQSLFEAARWAPSCNNEQPWMFIYATNRTDRDRFLGILNEQNRAWACNAPVLAFVLARKHFAKSGKENRHAGFDAGAAWMSLALQAVKLGLYAHAMAGFSLEKAYTILGVPKDHYDIIAAVAVGKKGDPAILPEELRSRESPNTRKPLANIAFQSGFPKEYEA